MTNTNLPQKTMFASNGLVEHLLRGVVGIGALSAALAISADRPWSSLALAGVMMLAFRGCPTCWTIGLIETTWRSLRTREGAQEGGHEDGSTR